MAVRADDVAFFRFGKKLRDGARATEAEGFIRRLTVIEVHHVPRKQPAAVGAWLATQLLAKGADFDEAPAVFSPALCLSLGHSGALLPAAVAFVRAVPLPATKAPAAAAGQAGTAAAVNAPGPFFSE